MPKLDYDYAALEPYIDAKTMEIHHSKHHQGYVDKLNGLIKGSEWEEKELEWLLRNLDKLPGKIRTGVRNNGGGHYNHSLFWQTMTDKTTKPEGKLGEAIERDFGGLEEFKEKFKMGAMSRFGSGWVWLCSDKKGFLHICSTANQDNCLMRKVVKCGCNRAGEGWPILGLDVWEHAYYLKYQNRRDEYVDKWWSVVNWQTVGENYAEAMNQG